MRNLFMRCVALATLGGMSVGLAGSLVPDGNEGPAVVPLFGTSWTLVSLGGQETTDGPAVTLRLEAEGTLGGFDGCNAYRGAFKVDGAAIHIAEEMAATRAACAEPITSQASAYIKALGRADTFTIDGDRLRLQDDTGQAIAVFESQSLTLSRTSWEVVGFNNGKQAVVSVLRGTSITAHFDENGQVTGSGGCNRYFAAYETAAESIKIGMPGTTRMFCAEPDVMQQETHYLGALHTAASFRHDADKLVLRSSAGDLAVTLVSDPGVPSPPDVSPETKLRFDLNRVDADGLQGPPDGLRALDYEYCIPDRPEAIEAVREIDPSVQFHKHSPGRVGCGADQLLCLGHTHQPDHGAVLDRLTRLPFIAEIREAHFE